MEWFWAEPDVPKRAPGVKRGERVEKIHGALSFLRTSSRKGRKGRRGKAGRRMVENGEELPHAKVAKDAKIFQRG
jgi:hypothetical protein